MAGRTSRRIRKPGEDIHDQPTVVEPDEYELEEVAPAPARRSGRTSGRGQAYIQDEGGADIPAAGSGFKKRWLASIIGSLAAWSAYSGLQWQSLQPSWNNLFTASEIAAWQHYTLFGLTAVVCAGIMGIFIAAIDKSGFRNFISGIAWFAVVTLFVNVMFLIQPAAAVQVKERLPALGEMIRLSLMPSVAAFEAERQDFLEQQEQSRAALKAAHEKATEQQTATEALEAELAGSKKDADKAALAHAESLKQQEAQKATLKELAEDVAALKITLDASQTSLADSMEKVKQAAAAAQAHDAALKQRDDQITEKNEEITALKAALSATKKELQRVKDMAAMEKMGANPEKLEKAPGIE